MTSLLAQSFQALAAVVAVGVPIYAGFVRGRTYGIFTGVVLAFAVPGAIWVQTRLPLWCPEPLLAPALALGCLGVVAAGLHLGHLVQARLRGRVFRFAVSVPGQVFVAAGFMSGVWLLGLLPLRALVTWTLGSEAAAWLDPLDVLPLVVAIASVVTSARPQREFVRIRLGRSGPKKLTRVPVERHRRAPTQDVGTALRLLQITDPHLGPWQSVERLRRRVEELASREPHLVLLTGDFLTMEGRGSAGALAAALAPLQPHAERCFAIFGNHDHEAPDEVRHGLEANGIRLLVDEEATAKTPVGDVQIVGADYRFRDRGEHLETLLGRYPRRPDHLRLLLLHDPSAFHHVPDDDVDLTLSGHTHGGQVGLVSLGLDWTVLSGTRWPDHGLFARGSSRLYVHRGTGFYGFPLRVGVPGEASILELIV
ncbi:MAG: metallophosphoesterase [Proteobacteria bacterium]|nr:metallophosphoesterase [Pseudomonadota bacterium]